jgi:uncharacterized RDD family membrane protein YckC
MSMAASDLEYVGFWLRVVATLVDALLLVIVTAPLNYLVYGTFFGVDGPSNLGAEFFISWLLPSVATVGFWAWAQATPGKMVVRARIVDATTGSNPTAFQCVVRYLGYFLSIIPLFLGVIWVAFDPRKQAWHDKLAGTVIVRPKDRQAASVRFDHR